MKIFTDNRQWYTPDTSIGQLLLPDNRVFCYTLADAVRAWGIKVKSKTAIPPTSAGLFYKVAVTHSQRFGKELPIIYTDIIEGRCILKSAGISFEAVRFHGLNDATQTDGCTGVAFEWDGKDKIFNPDKNNRADDALTKIIKDYIAKGESVGLVVRNLANKFV